MKKQSLKHNADILNKYVQDIEQYPRLNKDEEIILARKVKQGDPQAINELVRANLKFVIFIAREYEDCSLPLDELVSEGNLGLIEAARRFDVDRGNKFISYAVWWIRQSILRALGKYSRTVRLQINRVWVMGKVVKAIKKLEQELGRSATIEELAEEVEISPQELSKNLVYMKDELFLDDSTRPDNDQMKLIDQIGSEEFDSPLIKLFEESMKTDIKLVLKTVDEAEERVLRLYYGIENEHAKTLNEIGEIMNLSRERIRQIKNSGLRKLRYLNRREKLQQYLD